MLTEQAVATHEAWKGHPALDLTGNRSMIGTVEMTGGGIVNDRMIAVVLLAVLAGCTSGANGPAAGISCQPSAFSPAPVAFSFAPGPVTSSVAEQTAVALLDTCEASGGKAISDVKKSSAEATGRPTGPNDGQSVWLVHIDATVNETAVRFYHIYWLVEVNKASGIPTVVDNG